MSRYCGIQVFRTLLHFRVFDVTCLILTECFVLVPLRFRLLRNLSSLSNLKLFASFAISKSRFRLLVLRYRVLSASCKRFFGVGLSFRLYVRLNRPKPQLSSLSVAYYAIFVVFLPRGREGGGKKGTPTGIDHGYSSSSLGV